MALENGAENGRVEAAISHTVLNVQRNLRLKLHTLSATANYRTYRNPSIKLWNFKLSVLMKKNLLWKIHSRSDSLVLVFDITSYFQGIV
jgi:hypothetical protein